jgi:hypothetical protein
LYEREEYTKIMEERDKRKERERKGKTPSI